MVGSHVEIQYRRPTQTNDRLNSSIKAKGDEEAKGAEAKTEVKR